MSSASTPAPVAQPASPPASPPVSPPVVNELKEDETTSYFKDIDTAGKVMFILLGVCALFLIIVLLYSLVNIGRSNAVSGGVEIPSYPTSV